MSRKRTLSMESDEQSDDGQQSYQLDLTPEEDDVSPVVIKKKETPPITKFQRMSDTIKDFPSHEEAKIFVKLNRMKYGYFLYL
jgi:hypothetical protein